MRWGSIVLEVKKGMEAEEERLDKRNMDNKNPWGWRGNKLIDVEIRKQED